MFKVLVVILFFFTSIFSQETIYGISDTTTIKNTIFENYDGNFIIKNYGVLILENCIFRNNSLGSKNSDAIFLNDHIAAPIINYGKLSLLDCKFENNYSYNTALTDELEAQASAGAIANFSELNLSNTVFQNNIYQRGYFTILYNESTQQFSYIGNDSIYNHGNITIQNTSQSQTQKSGLQLDVGLIENPVKSKAEILVNTNMQTSISISIFDAMSNTVFSISSNLNGAQTFTWNLQNPAGNKVSIGTYSLRVSASDNNSNVVIKTLAIGVKE